MILVLICVLLNKTRDFLNGYTKKKKLILTGCICRQTVDYSRPIVLTRREY